jgi:CHAT domain-containing protein/Tfp pilus assembly protein PilF
MLATFKNKTFMVFLALVVYALSAWPPFVQADSLQEADRLNSEVVKIYKEGKYKEALSYAEKALAFCEKNLGPENSNTATALDNLANIYYYTGAYEKAEPLLLRVLTIREKALGAEHIGTALSLNNLAYYYHHKGEHDKAEPLFQRALKIYEKTIGPDKPDTAIVVRNLADLYNKKKAYSRAEPYYRQALKIYSKNLGVKHKNVGGAVNSLITLYEKTGDFAKAEALLKEFLASREKYLGEEHADTLNTLHQLFRLYKKNGFYEKAAPVFKRIVAIIEKTSGPEHPQTALYLDNLAMLYYKMGQYDQAESLLKRSLAIREKVLGPEHVDTAQSMGDLATLYSRIGSYDRAELLYKSSLAIHEKVSGREHPDTAISLSNLSTFYSEIGLYDQVRPLYERALAIFEKTFGPEHPYIATMLGNLAQDHIQTGSYDQAEPLLKRSLAIREKVLGAEHPETASSLRTLASLDVKMGRGAQAESLYKRALAIDEKALGREHPETALVMHDLALLYASSGRNKDALPLLEEVQKTDQGQINQIMGFASEEQQRQFITRTNSNLFIYLSLIHKHFPDDAEAASSALGKWLARKGLLLETQQRIQDFLSEGSSPQAREIFNNLVKIRQDLAGLALRGIGEEGPDAHKKRLAELSAKKEDLEAELSRLSKSFARKRLSWYSNKTQAINTILPRSSVLLDIARIQDFDFKAGKWATERYLAFILAPSKYAVVSLIDLGEAWRIDEKVSLLKKALKDTASPRETLVKNSTDLYRIVFAPLKKSIGHAQQIFISPDGSLNLIPFEVLRNEEGRLLIEDYHFNYVSAGRDITGFGLETEKGRRNVLIGDPDFDLAAKTPDKKKNVSPARSRQMTGIVFPRLKATREEVTAIADILGRSKCDIYVGKEARESVLHGKESPQILHLATHGFFLSDQDWSSLMDQKTRGIALVGKETRLDQKPVRTENPLLRSGLALAGANNSLALEGSSEGILTADKILGLNLTGTDLVVLSACETGVGEVRSGEGVYGLRRAFTQAGAKRLVMSMWEVPDRETKELMVNFFGNLQKGAGHAEALRQAALMQRDRVKKRYGHDHPYYWGAFVFLGDPL